MVFVNGIIRVFVSLAGLVWLLFMLKEAAIIFAGSMALILLCVIIVRVEKYLDGKKIRGSDYD